jgi:hypothetical protein
VLALVWISRFVVKIIPNTIVLTLGAFNDRQLTAWLGDHKEDAVSLVRLRRRGHP